jgi:hypothetical protein
MVGSGLHKESKFRFKHQHSDPKQGASLRKVQEKWEGAIQQQEDAVIDRTGLDAVIDAEGELTETLAGYRDEMQWFDKTNGTTGVYTVRVDSGLSMHACTPALQGMLRGHLTQPTLSATCRSSRLV